MIAEDEIVLRRLITGHYPSGSGQFRLDGRVMARAGRDDFRQFFFAVFAGFYVFETWPGLDGANLNRQPQNDPAEPHLDHGAGRIIKLDSGKLVYDRRTAVSQLEPVTPSGNNADGVLTPTALGA
jgi:hypothetical protein